MNNEPNISVFDAANGTDDFPVLKAFQQYIDAEQAKARRRLLTVCIFFGCVLVSVIIIFSILIGNSNDRNQTLNDRLVEYAMKESETKAEAVKAAALQEATVKSMNDTLQKLQKQLEDQERKANAAAEAAAKELADAKADANQRRRDPEAERRQAEVNTKLQKAMAKLKDDRAKLEEEKEKLHQQQLELYRRKYYPEYYEKNGRKTESAKSPSSVEYFDDEDDLELPPLPKKTNRKRVEAELDLDDDQAIEYFKDDTYTIPVEVKGERAGWRVPLN